MKASSSFNAQYNSLLEFEKKTQSFRKLFEAKLFLFGMFCEVSLLYKKRIKIYEPIKRKFALALIYYNASEIYFHLQSSDKYFFQQSFRMSVQPCSCQQQPVPRNYLPIWLGHSLQIQTWEWVLSLDLWCLTFWVSQLWPVLQRDR